MMSKSRTVKRTVEEIEAIVDDFLECAIVAHKLDSLYPEMPGAFIGTVSERLNRHLQRIIKGT